MAPGGASTQSYLTSSIPGEDRRAPTNTIDETVWETLSRDLLAIWEKMKQVLYPKYLLGGMMQQSGGIGAAERGEADGFGGGIRNLAGRWPDADVLLQNGMSEGLRDWDTTGVPDERLVLVLPPPGSRTVAEPVTMADGTQDYPDPDDQPPMRSYTVREWDPVAPRMSVEFVVHDDNVMEIIDAVPPYQ